MQTRGPEREKNLGVDAYFSEHYFSIPQLLSMAQQLHEIFKLSPKSILEVGPGNGFVSTFLRRAGYVVTTVDINPALQPDICSPLHDLSAHLGGRRFDLVVCCEVLEHMPLSEFPANLQYLKSAGDRLFMTLPNYRKCLGFGGLFWAPVFGVRMINAFVDIPRKKDLTGRAHFWEVGSEKGSTKKAITGELCKIYREVNTKRFGLNPYHFSFYAR